MNEKTSIEKFIEKAIKIHGDKYDYSKVNYVNSLTKVIIICKKHGEFLTTPNSHIGHKSNCKICSTETTGEKLSFTKEQFIENAMSVHGNKYDYSKVNYKNMVKEITVICNTHGKFQIIPHLHISSSGCQKCSFEKMKKINTISTEEFIERAEKVHGKKYNYENTIYVGSKININILCYEHGEFKQIPSTHLQGAGCRKCFDKLRISKQDNSKKTTLTCKKCNIEKPVSEFKIRKSSGNHTGSCSNCIKQHKEKYNLENSNKIKKRTKNYRSNNLEIVKKMVSNYTKSHREEINKKTRDRMLTDPLFKLRTNIRNSIKDSFRCKKHKKTCKTVEILGCSFEEFKLYIESQFEPWMTWENHGVYSSKKITWQLDHKTPISLAKTKDDVIRLNHHTNFQPLEALKNILKSNKVN